MIVAKCGTKTLFIRKLVELMVFRVNMYVANKDTNVVSLYRGRSLSLITGSNIKTLVWKIYQCITLLYLEQSSAYHVSAECSFNEMVFQENVLAMSLFQNHRQAAILI